MIRRASHVVLINPPSPWLISDRDLPPLGLLSLAASLRAAGVLVEVCDLAGQPGQASGWIVPDGDLYGIGFTTPQYPIAQRLVKQLHRRYQSIVVGGPHASALPARTLHELGIDAVFAGEADWALTDYVQGRPLPEIAGLAWHDGSEVRVNPPPRVAVDLLPLPARDLIDIDAYHRADTFSYLGGLREGYIQTARGCPFLCAFCGQACVTGGRVRYRRIEQVVDEVRLLRDRYGCDQVYFEDDTFNVNRRRLEALCAALEGLEVTWHCLLRADLVDADMPGVLHRGGCRGVVFGFESGSDRMLAAMRKGLTAGDNLRAAELCAAADLQVRGQMIVGFPGETDETIAETEAFVQRAPVAKWGFHAFVPLPGSDVWAHPEVYGLLIDREHADFGNFTTIGRPGEWGRHSKEIQAWIARLNEAARGQNVYEGMEGQQ